MLDNEFRISTDVKATLVSLVCPTFKTLQTEAETLRSLGELKELLRTLGISYGSEHIQNKKTVEAGTILGKGKLLEIAEQAKLEKSKLLVCDFELTASQGRNIKEITGIDVVDRCQVILEIFAKHARTKEAQIQIEISRLKYLLPRLAGFWSHLERQRSVIGVVGGAGEQQIELDRRQIRNRIRFYEKELKTVVTARHERKKKREQMAVVTAAIVGYTNAGKSSLMNRLCRVNVREEDKLFATLDATYRTLNPDTHPSMILIDTVGFISNLPNTLIEGFKTTLDSALEADLLIIVCDISDPHYKKHLEVTEKILSELKVWDKEKIIVFNKSDKFEDKIKAKIILRTYPNSFLISTYNDKDVTNLRQYIINFFLKKQDHYDLFIPYDDGQAHAKIKSKTNVMSTANHERGIFYRIRIPQSFFDSMNLHRYILGPEDPIRREFLMQK